MSDEKVRQAIADYDAAHPYWRQEKREREIREAKEAEKRAQRAREDRRQAEQQHRQLVATNNSKAWCDWVDQRIAQHIGQLMGRDGPSPLIDGLGEVVATEREARRKETKAAVDEAKRAVDAKLTAAEERISSALPVLNERLKSTNALGERVFQESADWRKECQHALEESQRNIKETKRDFEVRLVALEKSLNSEACKEAQRAVAQERVAADAKLETYARAVSRHIEQAAERVTGEFNGKLAKLEERIATTPGKLPVAKSWRQEAVTYQAEFVSHEGSLYQARRDTAQVPGGSDWVCVARAGIDAVTPTVRGTFDTAETYKHLDLVACDGATFVAKRDAPGRCSGPGWQLLSRQGKPGRRGETGERGPRGERGEKGEAAPTTVSWQIDAKQYRAIRFLSNGTPEPELNLRPLFEAYGTEVIAELLAEIAELKQELARIRSRPWSTF